MDIEIKKLNFRYKENLPVVLSNISLSLKDSSVITLLGLNGCGKTTLIKCLSGLFQNPCKNIFYDNIQLSTISYRERSKIISYVPQKANNIDDVLIRDYLTYGMVNTLKFYQKPGKEELEKVEEISERFKISHLLNKNMGDISGGERQKICICTALLQNTKVILLDEPTSALDLKNQNLVLSILKDISQKEDKTIILSTHNPNHALLLKSKVALMNNGNISDFGNAEDIINTESLSSVYGNKICYSSDLPYKEISFSAM